MKMKMKHYMALAKRYKIGLTVGAVTGFAAASFAISQGQDLTSLAETGKGLLDGLIGRNATVTEMAKYKLYGVFTSFGAIAGFYAEMLLERTKFLKKRR